MRRKDFFLFLGMALIAAMPARVLAQPITDDAQRLYQEHHRSVVQIHVIDLATGKKTSLGSGFQFSPQGHVATNFHVIAEAVHAPQRFRVDYLRYDGTTGKLHILDVDVVHDLAILHVRDVPPDCLVLGESHLSKGTRLFAMGNPFDLGMSIVEGIYNGLMEDSLYKKILFSGSLNPGMSGGPALNREGQVIGVNVSTAGNEVSFLVPVDHLKKLYDHALAQPLLERQEWKAYISQQLDGNQEEYMGKLLSSDWDTIKVGEANVPGEILKIFKCWGKSEDKDEDLYNHAYINCSTNDNIFIAPGLATGQIFYQYYWMTSKGLNPVRFYYLYENRFQYPHPYENAQDKEDVTNFRCDNNFVRLDHGDMKVVWCARNYKKYPLLYDINLSMALIDQKDRGLLVELVALGVGKKNAVALARKFMKEIRWRNSLLK